MTSGFAIVSICLLFCVVGAASAQEWRPATAPLLTRWAKDVDPKAPRPDYPRPQFVRKQWMSLNGLWEFAFDKQFRGVNESWPVGRPLPDRILVPFAFESALSGIGKGKEIHERVWYRRTFRVPAAWKGRSVLLHFGACDWKSRVWVNGREAGSHTGGYTPFDLDITAHLRPAGEQEIVVRVDDPADPRKGAFQPKGKQLGSEGIWYTRTTGIWQSVWLEPVSNARIEEIQIDSSHDGTLKLEARLTGPAPHRLRADVVREGKVVATATLSSTGNLERATIGLRVPNARAWSPEKPNLYDLKLTLWQGGKKTDDVNSYCAFRSFGMEKGRLTLNGRPYFVRAVLDQGFWPDGIYTPPTDAAIRNDVEMTKALGFNMARKHVKVEDPRWYYWCDRLGLLVAQDMPSSHNLSSWEARGNFTAEWREVMQAVRNYPSVVMWIPFNENWGDPKEFQDDIVRLTRSLDQLRPIVDASGWTQREETDVIDVHEYGNDLKKHAVPHAKKPKWVGEYGGVALPVEGHTWISGWGYQTVKTPDELVAKIGFLTSQIDDVGGLSGFCYTQLTDVEQELNGLLTYDRLPKTDPSAFRKVLGPK